MVSISILSCVDRVLGGFGIFPAGDVLSLQICNNPGAHYHIASQGSHYESQLIDFNKSTYRRAFCVKYLNRIATNQHTSFKGDVDD